MNSNSEENYIKAIFKAVESKGDTVTTGDVTRIMHTSAASVTDMLKKLSAKKLIHYKRYSGLSLTPTGRQLALQIVRKHRLWEMFLVKTLDFKWHEVHDIAEQLEHVRSDKLTQHLDRFLNYPKFDPHGDPIPDKHGRLFKGDSVLLSEAKPKTTVVVAGVINHSADFLRYLDKNNIGLGVKITIQEVILFDKSLVLLIEGKRKKSVSNQIAKNILVSYGESNT